ncbi:histidine phosphatase family protein [Planococcus sp. N028]|uniref:Histidine phosphatase family protein n=1 Tax=Planococcus shixiaomingii TaxID=3058393 RepID=A0ABT8MYS4_9BACL|nr:MULTISPECIES: histidine phosphatase family protein [unclassified Planococcus (in: firmicutes)]MDN7240796.1 histidine phosphatase family protein [Planococcus sp. N028]WKA56744.1 histidine phosphatase family protein [Planococcus sp. N022]
MTTICLVRHGETDWNAQGKLQGSMDIPLNANGILQAKACSEHLKETAWDYIVTSPLQRAKNTAEIINGKLDVPLIVMAEFMERHFGDAEGMTLQDRRAIFPDKKYPNQEPASSFHDRLIGGVQKINQQFANSRILLVAHGAVIDAILTAISSEEKAGNTPLQNGCMSHIHFNDNNWQVKSVNEVSHLFSQSRS